MVPKRSVSPSVPQVGTSSLVRSLARRAAAGLRGAARDAVVGSRYRQRRAAAGLVAKRFRGSAVTTTQRKLYQTDGIDEACSSCDARTNKAGNNRTWARVYAERYLLRVKAEEAARPKKLPHKPAQDPRKGRGGIGNSTSLSDEDEEEAIEPTGPADEDPVSSSDIPFFKWAGSSSAGYPGGCGGDRARSRDSKSLFKGCGGDRARSRDSKGLFKGCGGDRARKEGIGSFPRV